MQQPNSSNRETKFCLDVRFDRTQLLQIAFVLEGPVHRLLRTKRLLGLEAVLKDDRGLKAIAQQAAQDLDMEISRSAVARIRTEKGDRQRDKSIPTKKELMDLARVAEAIEREHFDARQLRLNFECDPELKEKREEFSKEPAPKAERETEKNLIERLQEGERYKSGLHIMKHIKTELELVPFMGNILYYSRSCVKRHPWTPWIIRSRRNCCLERTP